MAEVIQIRDLQAARERAERRASDQQNVDRALNLMRENLLWVAARLQSAPVAEQPELLDRIEKLAGLIRYGMQMTGESVPGHGSDGNFDRG
jgi:hypothetical protein